MNFPKEVVNVINVLATPLEVFEDIKNNPRLRVPAIVALVCSITVGWFMIEPSVQPLRIIYERSFDSESASAAISSMMKIFFVLRIVLTTVSIYIRWVLFSLLLMAMIRVYMGVTLLGFKETISLVAYCEIIFIAMSVLTVLIIYAIGVEKIERSTDLQIFKGLDYFMSSENRNAEVAAFLSNLNIFSVWYVLVISSGIRLLTGLKKLESLAVTGVAWLCWSTMAMLEPWITNSVIKMIS